MRKPIRIGVIGCGNVLSAYRAAIDSLRGRQEAECVVACGRPAQRDVAVRELGNVTFVSDPELVLRSPDVDLVLILTSMRQHAALAGAALDAGKHVVMEKPLATTLAEADALVAQAARSDRLLVCAPFTPLSPTFQTIARRIRRGDIGTPCQARARYGWSGPDWSDWFYQPGGGCLFDLGVYCLTSLTALLGPVRRVMAMTGVAIPTREIQGRTIQVQSEDNAQVLLDFGASTFGVVTTGFTLQQYRTPALEIYGTTGTVQLLGDDWDPEGYELWQNSVGAWQVFKETAPDWPWTDGLRHAVSCIRTGTKPVVSSEHARHVLEIMLAAQQSGREGRAVEMRSQFSPLPLDPEPQAAEPAHLVHDRSRPHLA